VSAIVLADQAKSLDWRARAELLCTAPQASTSAVLQRLETLVVQ